MESRSDGPSGPVEKDPFVPQKGLFHPGAAPETAQSTARAKDTMTGDDQGKGIARHDVSDRPGGARVAQMPGEDAVGADATPGDPPYRAKDLPPEPGTGGQIEKAGLEPDVLPVQESLDGSGDAVDPGAGLLPRIRMEPQHPLLGGPRGRRGEEYPFDPGSAFAAGPEKGHRTDEGGTDDLELEGRGHGEILSSRTIPG